MSGEAWTALGVAFAALMTFAGIFVTQRKGAAAAWKELAEKMESRQAVAEKKIEKLEGKVAGLERKVQDQEQELVVLRRVKVVALLHVPRLEAMLDVMGAQVPERPTELLP